MTLLMKVQLEREDAAINARIETAREFGATNEVIIQKLMSKFDLTKSEAEEKLKEYENSLQLA